MTDPTRRSMFTDSVWQAIKFGLPLSILPVSLGARPLVDLPVEQRDASGVGDKAELLGGEPAELGASRVDSLAELRALPNRPSIVFVAGYHSANDGGGGFFSWASGSTTPADDVISVAPISGPPGRYFRQCGSTINVMWAGASGRGEVDDTTPFRAALAAGSTVFVPPGIYKIADTLSLDGATVFGTGSQSVLKCGNARFNLFDVSGSGARIYRLSIWGAATDTTTAQFGIMTSTVSPPQDFSVAEVQFSGPDRTTGLNNAIKFQDHAKNCRVQNNHFERLIGAATNGYGVLTGAVDGLIVAGNIFQGSRSVAQGRHAVYVSAGGRRVTASQNVVREFNFEALATNAYAHHEPVEQLIFAHNVIYRCGGDGGNQSSISVAGRAKTIRIEGNIVVESFGCGILCDAGSVVQEDVSVDGNTIIDASYF